MDLFLQGLTVLVVSAVLAVLTGRSARTATWCGVGGAVAGCGLAFVSVVRTLFGDPTALPATLTLPWQAPLGAFVIGLDALSAWFALPIAGLSALAAVYGGAYWQRDGKHRPLGAAWCFFNLLVASMLLVVTARDSVLFLAAWEVMAVASYFLVIFHDEEDSVRSAGRTYLIASHLGVAFLFAMFMLLNRETGSFDWDAISGRANTNVGIPASVANWVFVLAVIGFGTKAGFMPLHVWLPEAHPVAPSHVSALMSGLMIKTGIYGLIRVLTWLGAPPSWWGWLLVVIGLVSGVMGALYAIAQPHLKRLLAFSSVENIGVISLGLGAALLGEHLNEPSVAVLGFAGVMFHVLNHAIFKGLLFLSAGCVIHETGTGNMEQLGGLLKRMPVVGFASVVGVVSICALPPLNGFVSEFLIYLAAFEEETLSGPAGGVPALAVIGGLGLIGGLAAVCFTRAFGIVFLGEPRSAAASQAHSPSWLMQGPLLVLAVLCVVVSFSAEPLLRSLAPVLQSVVHQPGEFSAPDVVQRELDAALGPIRQVLNVSWALVCVTAVVAGARLALLRGRSVGTSPTWDCGYAAPTARMQYTGSSFGEPLLRFFEPFLKTRQKLTAPRGLFPTHAALETETPDAALERGYRPAFVGLNRVAGWLSWIQHGRTNLYVLYIAVTLIVLLVWSLGSGS